MTATTLELIRALETRDKPADNNQMWFALLIIGAGLIAWLFN